MKLSGFKTKDLILITLMAALGLAVKPLIKTFTHLLSSPLGIPGGTLAGGFYMMWLTMPLAMIKKPGTATLTGLLQGFTLLITGWYGTHGALSIITYALPGVVVDLAAWLYKRFDKFDGQIIYCLLANITGTWVVGLMIMKLPRAPLIIALSLSVISGIMGGALSYIIYLELKKYKVI